MSLDDVELHFINSTEQVAAFKRWLGERRPENVVSIDTESTGLSKENDRVRLVQIGDAQHGWALDRHDWFGVVREFIADYDGVLTGSNIVFDYEMLKHEKVELPIERCRDTRIDTHILEPTKPSGLKPAGTRHVDSRASMSQRDLDAAMKQNGWTWATVPTDFRLYWMYGALDTVIAAQLDEVVHPRVMAEAPDAHDLELSVSWVANRMERYGAHVDVNYAREHYDKFMNHCDKIADWCREHFKVEPGSNQAVIKVLEDAGYVFTKATKSGAICLDKEVLAGVDHPLASAVLERRRLQKIASTYLEHFYTEVDSNDLIHPSINTLGMSRDESVRDGKGVRTSRMSMSQPNLQNLPRRNNSNPAANVVRNSIIARTGHTLLLCDFDQIEMRALAHVSQDEAMIKAFHSEGDFFLNLASQIYETEITDKKDPRRQVTKNAGYAKIFGAGIPKFALTAGISEEAARAVMHRFDTLYPGGRRFMDAVVAQGHQTRIAEGVPYARSPLTNRRQVADPGKEYALVNYLIQGMAAEIFKMKLLDLDASGLGQWLVVPVHDEIILDVPNEHVIDAVETLEKLMSDFSLLSVPITSGVGFGQRWGEKQDWDVDRWRASINT